MQEMDGIQEGAWPGDGKAVRATGARVTANTALPFVFFDLETTGLPRTSEIIQIGAVYKSISGATYVSSLCHLLSSFKPEELCGFFCVGLFQVHHTVWQHQLGSERDSRFGEASGWSLQRRRTSSCLQDVQ